MAEIRRDEGIFPARDATKIFWVSAVPEGARAHVVLVHGYAEHIGRYAHVMDDFAAQGLAVHGFDCRGHGKSKGPRGHVRLFRHYLDDLDQVLERARIAAEGKKLFLMGHSHGALISTQFALTHQPSLAGLVLTSPYFRLALKPPKVKLAAAKLLERVAPWLPLGNEIKSEDLSRDPEMIARHKADTVNIKTTTPGWFGASTAAQNEVLAGARGLALPLGMFVGGPDPVADPRAAREFFEAAGVADKTYREYPGALHEVLNETNRAEVLSDIRGWIEKHL